MSIVVVGLGSMGKRRTRHLVGLGCTELVAVDPREELGMRLAMDA